MVYRRNDHLVGKSQVHCAMGSLVCSLTERLKIHALLASFARKSADSIPNSGKVQ